MNIKTAISVEEYLKTSFEEADCEYLDGEIVERNMGELAHGIIQTQLAILLSQLGISLGLQVIAEIRVQISRTRFRVADISAWKAGSIGTRIPLVDCNR